MINLKYRFPRKDLQTGSPINIYNIYLKITQNNVILCLIILSVKIKLLFKLVFCNFINVGNLMP